MARRARDALAPRNSSAHGDSALGAPVAHDWVTGPARGMALSTEPAERTMIHSMRKIIVSSEFPAHEMILFRPQVSSSALAPGGGVVPLEARRRGAIRWRSGPAATAAFLRVVDDEWSEAALACARPEPIAASKCEFNYGVVKLVCPAGYTAGAGGISSGP